MLATEEELACLVHNSSYHRLVCLNDVKARLYLPVTIFLSVLIFVGTLGNTTVCLVYWRRRSSRVSSNYFILSLAVLDLVTCVIGMPTEIADLLLPYTFQWPLACKILRFTHSSTIIASSTILIEVAFDRYYRICHLGRQFTAAKAKLLCLGASFLGIVCSWPTFILFGKKTVIRDLGGVVVTGSDCSTADSMRRTVFPMIYYVFLFLLFGLTITFFGVLYSKIGLAVLNRKRVTMVTCPSSSSTSQNRNQEKDAEDNGEDDQGDVYRRWPPAGVDQDGTIGRSVSATTILSSLAGSLRRPGKRRSHRVSSSNTRWYTVQPSERPAALVVNVKDGDNKRDSAATRTDCLSCSSDDKSKGDILSRAASLNKVITATHNLNVENYRNRSFTQSDMNMNKEMPRTTNEQRLDIKSHSDRDSLYVGVNSGLEEGLLESLQKFNLDFNRAFNVGDSSAKDDALREKTTKERCQELRTAMGKPNVSNATEGTGGGSSNSSDSVLTKSKYSNGDKKQIRGVSQLDNNELSSADDLSYCSRKLKAVNGCSDEFINQLNIYVSTSRLPQTSCGKESRTAYREQDRRTSQRGITDIDKAVVEANKPEIENDNEGDKLKPLQNQEHEQQRQQQQQEQEESQPPQDKYPHLLLSAAFKRKMSTAFMMSARHPSTSTRHSQRQVRIGKTTTVLFAVTLAYILSFLPYLTVMVLRSVVRDLEENLSPVGELAYKLCVKSFFINNAINPIIYSFLNQTFRSDAKQMFRRMLGAGGAGGTCRVQVRMLTTPQPASPGPQVYN
ncbi:orexin receptor type 2 [Elysia marginata]|uniref:Orexin receptor type 2 n=1 Tax=Elysia marginata TaxID=1093978 RepID=A0AAV4F8Z2_9GAST|nr:orexin receptor type 2 [Elysia marginata]